MMIARLGAALPATLAAAPPIETADDLARRPGHVGEAGGEALVQAAGLGDSESIVSAGVKQIPPPSEVSIRPANTTPRVSRSPSPPSPRRRCEADHEREPAPRAVGVATGERRQDALQRRAGNEPAGDQAWPPPRSAICSGARTSTAPNITEGMATKAVASRIGRLKIVSSDLAQVLAFGRLGLG